MSFNLAAEIKPLQSWFLNTYPKKRSGTHRVYGPETKARILSFVEKAQVHHIPLRQVELALGLADGTLKQWLRGDPSPELTSKAQLAIKVARAVLPFMASPSEVETKSVQLMEFSERRLQQMLEAPPPQKPTNGVNLKVTTREGYTIEGLSLEQVFKLIQEQ